MRMIYAQDRKVDGVSDGVNDNNGEQCNASKNSSSVAPVDVSLM